MSGKLPDYILLRFQRALIGEIYPAIRAIAVEFEEKKMLRIRYYLDREPTDLDRESISMLMSDLYADTSSNQEIPESFEECVREDCQLGELDALHGFVYARREYAISEEDRGFSE